METSHKTLANVISSQQTQGQAEGLQGVPQSFNTFLTVYSINLAHRFPDVTDLNGIDQNMVRRIAEFSIACATVALEAWEEVATVQDQGVRQRSYRKSA